MNLLGKILIIDGSNLLHRQLSQQELWDLKYQGKRTGAVFGFFRSLLVALNKYPTHYPIIVFDKGRSARRLALYPNYKHTEDVKLENDKKQNDISSGLITKDAAANEYLDELYRQGDVIKYLLSVMRVPVVSIRGWEGDDLMAILSRIADNGVIVTDDKDLYQLLSPTTQIFRPIRLDEDGNRGEVVTFEKAKHPVFNDARSYVVHKAIVGDPSDNIPKVAHGLGDKRAEVLTDYIISAHENPEAYLPIMSEMKEPYFKKFIDNHEQYLINKQLIDLSLIDMDPIVMSELIGELIKACQTPMLIDVVKALSCEGINSFDYTKMISHVSRTRKEAGNINTYAK